MTKTLVQSKELPILGETEMGQLNGLLAPIFRRILKTNKNAQVIIKAGEVFQEQFAQLLSPFLAKLTEIYMVTVNYDRTLKEMVEAGNYGYVYHSIDDCNVQFVGHGETDLGIVLLQLEPGISTEEALEQIDKHGFRPVCLPELLALGETYPEVECGLPIAAIGSTVYHHPDGGEVGVFAILLRDRYDPRRRLLDAHSGDRPWWGWCRIPYRFAVVPKEATE